MIQCDAASVFSHENYAYARINTHITRKKTNNEFLNRRYSKDLANKRRTQRTFICTFMGENLFLKTKPRLRPIDKI